MTLFAAFAQDLMSSPLGGVVFSTPEMSDAMRKLSNAMRTLVTDPLSVHPGWNLANSYYVIMKSHITMLQAQRIAKAGRHTLHETMKTKVYDEKTVNVHVDAWLSKLGIGVDEDAYDVFKNLLDQVSAMIPE